jgi:hypothetical protein
MLYGIKEPHNDQTTKLHYLNFVTVIPLQPSAIHGGNLGALNVPSEANLNPASHPNVSGAYSVFGRVRAPSRSNEQARACMNECW